MEYKSLPSAIKAIEGRSVTGVFAVHGNIDSYGDISHPGSFAKTLMERQKRVKFLWNHDFEGPAIAVIQGIREVGRDDLPDSVLARAPDATGGVEITRDYLTNARADAVFEAVASGAQDEMSYGYDPIVFDFSDVDGTPVRNLREVRLWEVSDVLFGANDATAGVKAMLPPLEVLLKQIEARLTELKAGARHSAADTRLLNAIHDAATTLGATTCKGMLTDDDDAEKSATDMPDERRAEPVIEPISLTLEKARLFFLDYA